MIQNGNLIRLKLDGNIISKLLTLDVSLEREMLDKTDKYSNEYKEVQPGNKSWSLSCEGYVVDPYDKNIIQYSENFENSFWVKNGLTISKSATRLDPFGFLRTFITSGASIGDDITYVSPTNLPSNTIYVFSVWVMSDTASSVSFDLSLQTGDANSTQSFAATSAWQRFSVSIPSGSTFDDVAICTITLQSNINIRVFGAQLEVGATPTSYEPTGERFTELFNAVDNGTKFQAIVTDDVTGNVEYEGDVYLSNLSLTAPQGQLTTFTCEITGTSDFNDQTI